MINSVENSPDIDLTSQNTLRGSAQDSAYIVEAGNTTFSDIKTKLLGVIENFFVDEEKSVDEILQDKFLNLDFAGIYDVNADKIGVNDAIFFVNLLRQQNVTAYSVEENNSISVNLSDGKTVKPTTSLMNILNSSISTNKPIRLDFDNNITVILKMDKQGKIQTHFLPGNAEVEAYLRNNLQILKQAYDEQEINYSTLSYSKYKDSGSKKEKRGNK